MSASQCRGVSGSDWSVAARNQPGTDSRQDDRLARLAVEAVNLAVLRRRTSRTVVRLPDEVGIFAALVILGGLVAIINGAFLDPSNLIGVVANSVFYGLMALAMTFVLTVGEIDLSVGSVFYLTAVISAQLVLLHWDPWLAALMAVVVGATLGAFNAAVSLALRIPVIIVTLGTLSLYRGLGLVLSGATNVVLNNTSSSFFNVATARPFGIPTPAILFIGLAIALHVLLRWTRFGYRVLAIGSNPQAARLVGIRSNLIRFEVMVLMGAFAGLTGALLMGSFQAVDSSVGSGYELLVISSVIIGGTSLVGGSGTVIGSVIGALVIQVISSGIVYLGVPATFSSLVTGAVILAAVALDRLITVRRGRTRWLVTNDAERKGGMTPEHGA